MLRIYNWDDYIGFHTIADFERATGIKVIYDLFDSNETLEAKLLVGDSGYDIVSTSENYYGRQIRAGLYDATRQGAAAQLEVPRPRGARRAGRVSTRATATRRPTCTP